MKMKPIQSPTLYENSHDNLFHQMRHHYLKLNISLHHEFEDKVIPQIEKVAVDKPPIQGMILQARMKKMQFMKVLRKGISIDDDQETNLQTAKTSGYYSFNNLMEKLSANDTVDEADKLKAWRQLAPDEQKDKLIAFADKFKMTMDKDVWDEFQKDLIKKLKAKYFVNSSIINWHKNSQSILEINSLVIHPSCFYWEED
jgi:hypothetical protein